MHPRNSSSVKIAGMVSIAGSARGGDDFVSAGLATVECIRALGACAGVTEPASNRQQFHDHGGLVKRTRKESEF